MSETGYVYTLNDPQTGEPKYVGATKNPKNRLDQHIHGVTNEEVIEWIEALENNGESPEMTLVRVAPIEEVSDYEQEVIQMMVDEWDLLNRYENSGYSPHPRKEREEGTHPVKVPDTVAEQAEGLKRKGDAPTISEAIRHMCREGDYDV